ncbi:MAG: MarR family transcriptional regulator [Chitinophagaceae bacterium]|jgi:DNA-binding transcriptional regulator GbsR (MarR family)|nr:MarR family transcriptional regulator [Chitinophagaceae bacterium]
MKLSEARQQFISTWGAMGTHWGINRTMAQVHALLMISPDPLTQDDIMAQLNISRGNVNMNIRDLIDWGLVDRVLIQGERKEYFTAEKDIWKVARQIIKERKRRELDPMMKLMDQLSKVDGDKKDKEVKVFLDTISGIKKFGAHADSMLDVVVKSDENWFLSTALKLFK